MTSWRPYLLSTPSRPALMLGSHIDPAQYERMMCGAFKMLGLKEQYFLGQETGLFYRYPPTESAA